MENKKIISLKKSIKLIINRLEEFDKRLDLEKVRNKKSKTPSCPKCNVHNLRIRQDKSIFCQSCGYDSLDKEIETWRKEIKDGK